MGCRSKACLPPTACSELPHRRERAREREKERERVCVRERERVHLLCERERERKREYTCFSSPWMKRSITSCFRE